MQTTLPEKCSFLMSRRKEKVFSILQKTLELAIIPFHYFLFDSAVRYGFTLQC